VASHSRIPVSFQRRLGSVAHFGEPFFELVDEAICECRLSYQLPCPPASACSSALCCSDPVRTSRAMTEQRIRIRRLALWQAAKVALHKHLPALCRVHYRREPLLLRALMFCHGRDLTLLYDGTDKYRLSWSHSKNKLSKNKSSAPDRPPACVWTAG
jgi:hypothetical protein